mmetsp:Transcript_57770/g.135635  ORF Transcript_57770/g.135635 Transcript_57770/m.135635 type:complete len:289 (+) Transcript_57770:299-1165(+)
MGAPIESGADTFSPLSRRRPMAVLVMGGEGRLSPSAPMPLLVPGPFFSPSPCPCPCPFIPSLLLSTPFFLSPSERNDVQNVCCACVDGGCRPPMQPSERRAWTPLTGGDACAPSQGTAVAVVECPCRIDCPWYSRLLPAPALCSACVSAILQILSARCAVSSVLNSRSATTPSGDTRSETPLSGSRSLPLSCGCDHNVLQFTMDRLRPLTSAEIAVESESWSEPAMADPRATEARAELAAAMVVLLKREGSRVAMGVGLSSWYASLPIVILNTSSSSSLRNTVLFPTV